MLLKSFQVREFQSIRDSGPVRIESITSLVGKNEAGKSALLRALYRLNPIVPAEGNFDVTHDYPRMEVEDYRIAVEAKQRKPATPIVACYSIEADELTQITNLFGPECLKTAECTLSKSYNNKRAISIDINEGKALQYLIDRADLTEEMRIALKAAPTTVIEFQKVLTAQEKTEEVKRLIAILEGITKKGIIGYVFDTFLSSHEPKFLYFDEYYQMTGHENIEALIQRQAAGQLKPSDHPLLGLIRLARLELNDLINPNSTIELKNKLEGASNHLTKQVLRYWSQNKHLRMTFDVRPARPGDPAGMQAGTNIWGGVYDTRHQVTTELGSRSRGFVWFFSFLAWYSDVKKKSEPMIMLLDEPGLTLHAKAQHDLLRYFETELKGHHQLVYTTHSPFMIDPEHFERVRIVQDKSLEDETSDVDEGSKVLTNIFDASPDSLFPLQGALGYELHQTLFIGPNSLIVEGASDLLFIQAMSGILSEEGRIGLDRRWTITPAGGAAKVPTFVAMLGSQKSLKLATLLDTSITEQPKIEELYKEKLLRKNHVFTYANFTGSAEADVEDMFELGFYLDLVNKEFKDQLAAPIELAKLNPKLPRIAQRIESYLNSSPLKSGVFGHYRPARYFSEHSGILKKQLSETTKARFEIAFKQLNDLL